MIKHIVQGHPVCVTVTLVCELLLERESIKWRKVAWQLDGIVVARSLFHSSMNYRSVMIFGQAEEIT